MTLKLAVCTADNVLTHRVLQKRATVLCFTKDEDSVLVGDRTGEVFHYLLDDMEKPGGHLLGHFSMMLDMVSE